jgi:hypothetical protein
MKILMVLTSHDVLGNTGRKTGFWLEEYHTVFYVGGHGPMWDLAESADSITSLESLAYQGDRLAGIVEVPGSCRCRLGRYSPALP